MTAEELLEKGTDYLHGFSDVEEDYEKAIRYFFKALEAGSIEAIDKNRLYVSVWLWSGER